MMFNNNIYHWLNASTFLNNNHFIKYPVLDIYIQYALSVLIVFTCLQCFASMSSNSKKHINKPQLNKTQMTQYIETLINEFVI